MATAKLEKVREHFTTCVICTEKYNNPSTLLCHHTFCRSCLTSYIKTQPDAVQNKTIPCPSCRQVTRVPDPTKPVDEWAGQLKPSIIIVGLIDELDQEQGSTADTTNTSYCSPCAKLGETTSAVSWCPECEDSLCDRCVKFHRVGSSTRQHELTDVSGNIMRRRKRKTPCQEHKDEYIKFHCKDCNKSACHTCCIIYHRGCKSVVTIETMIPDITTILTKKTNILSKKLEMKSSRLPVIKEEIKNVDNLQEKVQQEIRSATEKIIAEIRKKEGELLDELKKGTEEEKKQLQSDLKTEEIDMQTLNQYREFIKQTLESESEMDLYDVYMACQSGVVEVGNIWNTERLQRSHVTDITFQPIKVDGHYLENLHPGKIGFVYKPMDKLFSTRLFETTAINTKEDETEPLYQDLSVVVVHGVEVYVVTDFNNKCVKSIYNRNNKLYHSRLLLANIPWGITQLKDNQVMVAVPHSRQIVTVAVTPDLALLSTISTSKPYYSLSMLGSTSLAAGGIKCVDILNMELEVMKSVTTHNNVELFTHPSYMCVSNKGHLLVSDWKKKTVTCLTSEGDVMWIYSSSGEGELGRPRGITTTSGGDILVVDCDLKKVIQLAESGQYVRDVLTSQDGLSNPRGICVDKEGSIWICEGEKVYQYICS